MENLCVKCCDLQSPILIVSCETFTYCIYVWEREKMKLMFHVKQFIAKIKKKVNMISCVSCETIII